MTTKKQINAARKIIEQHYSYTYEWDFGDENRPPSFKFKDGFVLESTRIIIENLLGGDVNEEHKEQ